MSDDILGLAQRSLTWGLSGWATTEGEKRLAQAVIDLTAERDEALAKLAALRTLAMDCERQEDGPYPDEVLKILDGEGGPT